MVKQPTPDSGATEHFRWEGWPRWACGLESPCIGRSTGHCGEALGRPLGSDGVPGVECYLWTSACRGRKDLGRPGIIRAQELGPNEVEVGTTTSCGTKLEARLPLSSMAFLENLHQAVELF